VLRPLGRERGTRGGGEALRQLPRALATTEEERELAVHELTAAVANRQRRTEAGRCPAAGLARARVGGKALRDRREAPHRPRIGDGGKAAAVTLLIIRPSSELLPVLASIGPRWAVIWIRRTRGWSCWTEKKIQSKL
jgi:hypothetical protein